MDVKTKTHRDWEILKMWRLKLLGTEHHFGIEEGDWAKFVVTKILSRVIAIKAQLVFQYISHSQMAADFKWIF